MLNTGCEASCPMGQGKFQLCATSAECPMGEQCRTRQGGGGLKICGRVLDGGSPPPDGGIMVDAGAGGG